MSTWGIVVAAGSGSRFGGRKQFELLGDRRVIDWSVGLLRTTLDGVVVVMSNAHDALLEADAIVPGGATRSDSVRAGLAAVPDDAEIVVVHDAARPLATEQLLRSVVAAVEAGADGAIPGVPVVDTIKRVDDSMTVVATVDRSDLVSVQTPQAFRASMLRVAHATDDHATDDAGLVEARGGSVVVVTGHVNNIKITVPQDLKIARALVEV